ncbi:MAG: ketoacyl-ACP synthase III [Herpetosiphonaceae bacterium]|nr:ketoacyl-ACP synthase III [Herpetosiphonaceae bacterium]
MYAAITGWGHYAPEKVLTNADLEQIVETSDEWIQSRTGIKRRHIAAPGQATADMATRAGLLALEEAGLTAKDIDLIVVATTTPDLLLPSTAALVQSKLDAPQAGAFDMNAACCGFMYALSAVSAMVRGGGVRRVLLCGAETISSYLNWEDRNTCVLFGDAAGAVIVEASDQPRGLQSYKLGAIPNTAEMLWVKAGATLRPMNQERLDNKEQLLQMNGAEVFKHAVRSMVDGSLNVLGQVGKTPADVDLMIPHQANLRIIEATAKRLEVPMEQVFVNIHEYGNTSAATIPVAISEAARAGRLHDGDTVLFAAFGGGLTWAAGVLTWGK